MTHISIFRSFAAFNFDETKDITSLFKPENIELSKQVHDQGHTQLCWAFSITSMLRNSKKKTLRQMKIKKENGEWVGTGSRSFFFDREMRWTESSEMFLELRNLLLLCIIPKEMSHQRRGQLQCAYLRAAVVRVKL